MLDARIILDIKRIDNLAAVSVSFEYQRCFAGSLHINCGGEPCGSGACDNNIIISHDRSPFKIEFISDIDSCISLFDN